MVFGSAGGNTEGPAGVEGPVRVRLYPFGLWRCSLVFDGGSYRCDGNGGGLIGGMGPLWGIIPVERCLLEYGDGCTAVEKGSSPSWVGWGPVMVNGSAV